MKNICEADVEVLRKVFERLKKFDGKWDGREDDPEDMWIEAPEMVSELVKEMGPVVDRLKEST